MRNYSIDDSNGTNICGGISELRIAQVAQEEADRTGATVLVYSSDGAEEYTVEPSERDSDEDAAHAGDHERDRARDDEAIDRERL